MRSPYLKTASPATARRIFHVSMPPILGRMNGAARATAVSRPPAGFHALMLISSLNLLFPHRSRQPARVLVELNGPRRAQLRKENDPAEVHREMLDADEDRVEDHEIAALDRPLLQKRVRR